MSIRASAETIKLLVAVGIGAAVLFAGQRVLDWKEGAEANEVAGRTMKATSGILNDGQKSSEDRNNVDTGVLAGRHNYNETYEEANRNEPETAARSDRAVPDSVRNAFRERRIARERLGCTGDDCQR